MTDGSYPPPIIGRRSNNGVEERTLHVVQGEHRISDAPDLVLVTILGSCVAACLRDAHAGVGGMNHFLLPGDMGADRSGEARRHAVHAMELLVNALLSAGASRNRLEAKVFGGARTMSGLADVGGLNAEFAIDFLERERIAIVGSCLRGRSGRRVQYWPVTGRARRSFIDYDSKTIAAAPKAARPAPVASGALELF